MQPSVNIDRISIARATVCLRDTTASRKNRSRKTSELHRAPSLSLSFSTLHLTHHRVIYGTRPGYTRTLSLYVTLFTAAAKGDEL